MLLNDRRTTEELYEYYGKRGPECVDKKLYLRAVDELSARIKKRGGEVPDREEFEAKGGLFIVTTDTFMDDIAGLMGGAGD